MNSSTYFLSSAAVFGIAFISAFLLTPLARQYGLRQGIVDMPGGRRRHMGAMPRTGGLALWAAFTIAILAAQAMPIERADSKEIIRFTGLLIGSTFIMGVGFLDDRYELSPLWLYVGEVVAGAIAILFLIFIETFNNPVTGLGVERWPYWFTVTLTLMWMGLMMNTVNLLDGSDGLAIGVGGIAALMIYIHSGFRLGQESVSLLAVALVGTAAGFLPYNFYPAKIIMGGGAYFLGFVLGVLSIIGGAKMATILLVMGLPLIDATWQASRRLLQGQNPMAGDRGHLHFRLIDAGISPRWIALGYYAFCACFGIIALTTTSQLFKLLALAVMFCLVVLVFTIVSFRRSLEIPS
jgi:UDP-GlcNAc:undecaprenyl-phosphate GlcNAc-1-phosphate transferase